MAASDVVRVCFLFLSLHVHFCRSWMVTRPMTMMTFLLFTTLITWERQSPAISYMRRTLSMLVWTWTYARRELWSFSFYNPRLPDMDANTRALASTSNQLHKNKWSSLNHSFWFLINFPLLCAWVLPHSPHSTDTQKALTEADYSKIHEDLLSGKKPVRVALPGRSLFS